MEVLGQNFVDEPSFLDGSMIRNVVSCFLDLCHQLPKIFINACLHDYRKCRLTLRLQTSFGVGWVLYSSCWMISGIWYRRVTWNQISCCSGVNFMHMPISRSLRFSLASTMMFLTSGLRAWCPCGSCLLHTRSAWTFSRHPPLACHQAGCGEIAVLHHKHAPLLYRHVYLFQ